MRLKASHELGAPLATQVPALLRYSTRSRRALALFAISLCLGVFTGGCPWNTNSTGNGGTGGTTADDNGNTNGDATTTVTEATTDAGGDARLSFAGDTLTVTVRDGENNSPVASLDVAVDPQTGVGVVFDPEMRYAPQWFEAPQDMAKMHPRMGAFSLLVRMTKVALNEAKPDPQIVRTQQLSGARVEDFPTTLPAFYSYIYAGPVCLAELDSLRSLLEGKIAGDVGDHLLIEAIEGLGEATVTFAVSVVSISLDVDEFVVTGYWRSLGYQDDDWFDLYYRCSVPSWGVPCQVIVWPRQSAPAGAECTATPSDSEVEPNDSFEQANVLRLSGDTAIMNGRVDDLCCCGRVGELNDFFRVTVEAGTRLVVYARRVGPGGGSVDIYDSSFRELASVSLTSFGAVPELRKEEWTFDSLPASPGGTYYIHVMAACEYTMSYYLDMSSAVRLAEPPSVPSSPQPSDGASAVSIDSGFALDWADCAGATSYDVYFDSSGPPAFRGHVSSSSWPHGGFTYETTYFWKVVAKNSAGSTSGPIWSFTTAPPNQAPDTPSAPAPTDGATNVPVGTDLLDWANAARATSYDIYFGTSDPPPLAGAWSLSYWTLDMGALAYQTTYYWQIVAKNGAGSTEGPVWSFTTEAQ